MSTINVPCPFCSPSSKLSWGEGCCFCDYSGRIPAEESVRLLDPEAKNTEEYPYFSNADLKAGRQILADRKKQHMHYYVIYQQLKYTEKYVTIGLGQPYSVTSKAIWSPYVHGAKRFASMPEAYQFIKDYHVSRRATVRCIEETPLTLPAGHIKISVSVAEHSKEDFIGCAHERSYVSVYPEHERSYVSVYPEPLGVGLFYHLTGSPEMIANLMYECGRERITLKVIQA